MKMNEEERLTEEGLKDTRLFSKTESQWQTILSKTQDAILSEEINAKIRPIETKGNLELVELCKREIEAEKEKLK